MRGLAFVNGIPISFKGRNDNFLNKIDSRRCRTCKKNESQATKRATFVSLISVNEDRSNTTTDTLGHVRLRPNDGLCFRERAEHLMRQGEIPSFVGQTLQGWYGSYYDAAAKNPHLPTDPSTFTEDIFSTLLELVRRVVKDPIEFASYHSRLREPFDFYKFGLDFSSVLLEREKSQVLGLENIRAAERYAKEGHNVIFLANHQSEGDPYAIDVMLDWIAGCDRQFCEEIIFMAGDRVTNDPVVSPFSAGRNLLTVYSKKHINDIPELRQEKLIHNRRTISETQRLFKKGGKVVWFAPSGGRDRRSKETSRVEISPFDDGAVDMMKFTAMKSGVPFHFYPMALWTYDMLPPPSNVGGANLGEQRIANYTPMHLSVGKEIDWEQSVPESVTGRKEIRRIQCEFIEQKVIEGYKAIGGYDY